MENNTKKILGWSAALIVGYIVYLKIKASSSKGIVPIIQGENSITQGENFAVMSDNIFHAMDGYGYTIQPIVDAFSNLNTNGDFNALSTAYGTRTLNSGFLNVFQSNYTGNLSNSLRSQLSSADLATLNQLLSSKKITIQL